MAGSIPPLISSSPPPLCAFDDDEEEEEDEFGVYAVAEELDYNECITYGGKDEGKQVGNKSRGEQDSTSQDSATDSGLCPDSEGMSPTPHSDEERQRVHVQLPNGHLEPTPTEASDLKEGLTSCDPSVAGLIAPKTKVCDDVMPTVEETLNNHDINLFNKFQDCSGDSNIVSTSGNNQESALENSKLFKNGVDSIVSSKNVLLDERDNCGSETFENEDNDSFENFQEFSGNKIFINHTSEVCIEEEDDSLQDFKECTEIPFKTNPENHISCSSEINFSEPLELEEQEVTLEKQYFGNATNTAFGNKEPENTKEVNSLHLEDEDDDFSEFTDFKANVSMFNEIPETEGNYSLSEHPKLTSEFKGSIEEAEQYLEPPQDESDDEFSNFADFSSSSCAFASAQSSNSVESTSHIPSQTCGDTDLRTDSEFQDWVSVFPVGTDDCPAPSSALLDPEDPVWVRLVLPEASPALSLQWAACLAHSNLLASLHIDSRNILWNSGVPRFAATLSRGPLQPVKAAETLPLQPAAAPAPQLQTTPSPAPLTQESVPDAHFDWGSSGLTNPLDSSHSSLLDLHFLVTLSTHLTINPKPVLSLPKTLSAEAEAILGSLRDLSFIRKNYIVFPINDT